MRSVAGDDRDGLAASVVAELHDAIGECKQRIVLGLTDVVAGVETGSTLANNDGSGANIFATEDLHAEALCVGVTAVAG